MTPASLVDPRIDTANRRFFFFSSACRPFGMVNLSPDTVAEGAWTGGYRYQVQFVNWFSHIHAWQMAGIPIMPTTGIMRGAAGPGQYRSHFSHRSEVVEPGYHRLELERYGITAELTATARVGHHRYKFSSDDTVFILLDLGAEIGPVEIERYAIQRRDASTFDGWVENAATRRRPKPVRIYFVLSTDTPIDAMGGWDDTGVTIVSDEIDRAAGGAYLELAVKSGQELSIKVAISYTGIEGAYTNMQSEASGWEFDRVRSEAIDEWNHRLGAIEVEGGTHNQRVKFYTDLYHALCGRRRICDVDGSYIDNTGNAPIARKVPAGPDGKPEYEHHNSDAFWGAQWTINVLWPLVYPRATHNFTHTFMDVYKNGGLVPRGMAGGNYTFVMVGAGSTALLASAIQKNIGNLDSTKVYEALRKNHMPGGLMSKSGYEHNSCIGGGIEYYLARGYIPEGIEADGIHRDGAGMTLDYAYYDWCLAQLAQKLGRTKDYKLFMERASSYRNLYNPETGFFHPRDMDGNFTRDFDPFAQFGFVEANGWQSLWYVPHDVSGLADLMGGRGQFIFRLNELFERASESGYVSPSSKHAEVYLNYGNQPSTHTAHLFNYVGAPWLTQKWVGEVMSNAKSDISPHGGYGGDEDQGLMGSLNALMGMGLFSMRGGCDDDPVYEITTPIFETVTIHLDPKFYPDANQFVIKTTGTGEPYIQSAELNGRPLTRCWFRHSAIARGGRLSLRLGSRPNVLWGADDPPPSMSDTPGGAR